MADCKNLPVFFPHSMKDLKILKNKSISSKVIFCLMKNNNHEDYINKYKYIYKIILSEK